MSDSSLLLKSGTTTADTIEGYRKGHLFECKINTRT